MLQGLRVLDLTDGIAGPYCTKLLADAGADVVVAEPPGGHPARRSDPGVFAYLHAGKRSISLDRVGPVRAGADVVVAGADLAGERPPGQVVVTITPFGPSGPWAGRPATEFTLQAACGSTGGRGIPGEEPLAAGGGLGEWIAGSYAAVGALAASMAARRDGGGDHVDVAVLDCMAVTMVTAPSVFADFASACDQPLPLSCFRRIEVPSIEPTADGWVVFTANSAQQFSDLGVLLDHPEIVEDERFNPARNRFLHREAFTELVHAWTRGRTTAEVLELASALRIPVAPVLDGHRLLDFPHFVERGVFVDNPSGGFRQPRVPYRISDVDQPAVGPVPEPGGDDGAIGWEGRPVSTATEPALPLAGVRVVDLTAWWAGPMATHLLAALGADVVKVESIGRPDLMRCSGPKVPADPQWLEWGPLFHVANTNKRGITIDLTTPEGQARVLEVLGTADLVVENYTPRVMEQFGLGWERLHDLFPSLGLVRMCAFGLDGPWRDHPGFAQTMESLSGLAWTTGWPDGSPTLVGGAGDPVAGVHAAFAALLALEARRADGTGHLVEATMVEAVLNVAAPLVIHQQQSRATVGRTGNRGTDPEVTQGVYPTRGVDAWIAVAGPTDAVLATLGITEVDEVAGVTGGWDGDELAEHLTAAGIPAAVVIDPHQVAENPQLRHRRLFETEHHPVTGAHDLPGLPFRLGRVPAWVRRPAPLLGQHDDEVLGEQLIPSPPPSPVRSR